MPGEVAVEAGGCPFIKSIERVGPDVVRQTLDISRCEEFVQRRSYPPYKVDVATVTKELSRKILEALIPLPIPFYG